MAFNGRLPDRRPEIVLAPSDAPGVAGAVRNVRERGLRIAVASGGHSLCGASLHDGGALIDLTRLRDLAMDPAARTAAVGPAVTGRALAEALAPLGLGFPVGHCGGVGLGGYLLAGGLGWNPGGWGPACGSLRAVDLVTAAGEELRADEGTEPDVLWAARGAGPAFPAIATRLHLDLHALPAHVARVARRHPLAAADRLAPPLALALARLPSSVEPTAGLSSAGLTLSAVAFCDSPAAAADALGPLDALAPGAHAEGPVSLADLCRTSDEAFPPGLRYAADAVWCTAGPAEVVPLLAGRAADAPSPRSLAIVTPAPPPPRVPAALAVAGRSYVACYAIWEDPADDGRNDAWLRRAMASLDGLVAGRYAGEADLGAAPGRLRECFSKATWARLEGLRGRLDPDGALQAPLGSGGGPRRSA